VAKEVNPPQCAGMAISIVNIGGFAASGFLQPLVGWVVDDGAGYAAGGSGDAYWLGIAVIVGWMLIGVFAATRLTETHCRNVWQPAGPARPAAAARRLIDAGVFSNPGMSLKRP
jgi:hypothetical protein